MTIRYCLVPMLYTVDKVINWDFYRLFLVVTVMLYVLIFFFIFSSEELPSEQDFLQKCQCVFKHQLLLLFSTVAIFYLIHRAGSISRIFLALFTASCILLNILARRWYGKLIFDIDSDRWRSIPAVYISDQVRLESTAGKLPLKDKDHKSYAEFTIVREIGLADLAEMTAQKDMTLFQDIKYAIIDSEPGNSPSILYKDEDILQMIRCLEAEGVSVYRTAIRDGHALKAGNFSVVGANMTEVFPSMEKCCCILGVNYVVSNVEQAVLYVQQHLNLLKGHYICFSNVHTTIMSTENEEYRNIQNGSAITFPDGNPIAHEEKRQGYEEAERVAGPDFMEEMFAATMNGEQSHFFYGSTEETLNQLVCNLKKHYPGINIKGTYSPPFRAPEEVSEETDREEVDRINASGADYIWIALGAPKQEKWMALHEGKISGLMLGVGAGVDFHAGTISRAPKWIQQMGLEWLYRLLQDPERLIKRYLKTNLKFILLTRIKK